MKREKYTLLDNLKYVVQGVVRWQRVVLFLTILQSIAEGFSIYVWLYAVKLIISFFDGTKIKVNANTIIEIVLAAAITELLLILTYGTCKKIVEGRMNDVRFKFMQMWLTKCISMPYEMMENPEVLNEKERSGHAFGGADIGIQGMYSKISIILPNIISACVASVILMQISGYMIIIVVGVSIIRFVLYDKLAAYEKVATIDELTTERRKANYIENIASDFRYGKDIRMFHMQGTLFHIMKNENCKIHNRIAQVQTKWKICYFVCDSIVFLQEAIMYGGLIYLMMKSKLSVSDFILYVGSVKNVSVAMSMVLLKYAEMKEESRKVTDFRLMLEKDITNTEIVRTSFQNNYEKLFVKEESAASSEIQKDGKCSFKFCNVSFQYPGSKEYVLKNLSIELKAGERLAVVGLNGAGKTTFIKLLCRLYEPTSGCIYLNGEDISKIPLEEYYKLIAPVFQEEECFALSLKQNVSMREPDGTNVEAVNQCVSNAGLDTTIKDLEYGLDTMLFKALNDNGIDLSGGQKQKLMLARALYKDAPVIILDEPTAALDAIAEYNCYTNFDTLIGNKTAVYISHRLSSTKFCDKIALFINGNVTEYGTHEELMRIGGEYTKLFEIQARYYVKEAEINA